MAGATGGGVDEAVANTAMSPIEKGLAERAFVVT